MPADFIDLISSPEPEVKLPAKAQIPPSKPVTYAGVSSGWSFDALSSDESSIEALPSANPSAKSRSATEVLSDRAPDMNGPRKLAIPIPIDVEPILLDDDDDDPFRSSPNPPPAKRRRVSSSPQALPSKTAIPKASGYKRSTSNIESSSRIASSSRTTSAPIAKRTNPTKAVVDDILFTSSPDFLAEARKRKEKRRKSHSDAEDEELPDLDDLGKSNAVRFIHTIDEDSGDRGVGSTRLSGAAKILADLSDSSDSDTVATKSTKQASKTTKGSSRSALDKYNASKAKEKLAAEKKEKAAEKKAAAEAEKEKKKQEKEEKARQKKEATEIAKVNVRRTDKKVSIKEMIVDIPSCLNAKLKTQLETFLKEKEAFTTEYETTLPVIKWRRNIDREYNEEKGMWDAVPKTIKSEDHIMCVLPAKDLVELVKGDEGHDLDAHVLNLKAKFDSCQVIYLVEGYTTWLRKNENIRKKSFETAVNSYLPPEPPTASQRRKKKEEEYYKEEIVENAFLRLQVVHGVLVHHTLVMNESAEWIVTFTEQISLRQEKLKNQTLDTAFCMETGQVKTGEDPTDTFVKMLQEMIRVTQAVAWGIVSEYPTVQQLVKGLEEHGPLALENCRKSANGNGAFQDKKVGPAISRRVYNIFMGEDPNDLAT